MNMVVFLSGIRPESCAIFFFFRFYRFRCPYQICTVQIICRRFRTVYIGELVLTVELVEWYKPKTCQLFVSTIELVRYVQFDC